MISLNAEPLAKPTGFPVLSTKGRNGFAIGGAVGGGGGLFKPVKLGTLLTVLKVLLGSPSGAVGLAWNRYEYCASLYCTGWGMVWWCGMPAVRMKSVLGLKA